MPIIILIIVAVLLVNFLGMLGAIIASLLSIIVSIISVATNVALVGGGFYLGKKLIEQNDKKLKELERIKTERIDVNNNYYNPVPQKRRRKKTDYRNNYYDISEE